MDEPEEERDVLMSGIKAGLSTEQLNFIVQHSDDWWQMDNISNGFKLGITLKQMEAIFSKDEPDPLEQLETLSKELVQNFRSENMEKAAAICQEYKSAHNVSLSSAAENLYTLFQNNYKASGWKNNGCLKWSDIENAGFAKGNLNELLQHGIISRRDTIAETYDLSAFERLPLIYNEDLATAWDTKDGEFFRLNNGYNGEIQQVLRAVLQYGETMASTKGNDVSSSWSELLKDAVAIEYKGIIFDDWSVDTDNNSVWAEICQDCAEKHMDLISNELDDAGAIGTCSVFGCDVSGKETDNEHHYYIDFEPQFIRPLTREQLVELESNSNKDVQRPSLNEKIQSAVSQVTDSRSSGFASKKEISPEL